MLPVPPFDLYTKSSVTFAVFDPNDSTCKLVFLGVNVMIHCNAIDGLSLNGNMTIDNWDKVSTGDSPSICSVRGSLTGGFAHTIAHADPSTKFSVSVYCVCEFQSSYAYLAGMLDEG